MIKMFVTGDNHIGRKYERYPEIKDMLIESRLNSLSDMVKQADKEKCSFFIVTGDLFDNVNNIKVGTVKQVADILSNFSGEVLVLPGNHDYYTGDEKLWKDFIKYVDDKDYNITLLNRFEPYEREAGEDRVIFYPAYCHAKHSAINNLGWIKSAELDEKGSYNIGIAHGAIKGITPDMKGEYFLMTEDELKLIPMDAWLLGHTHIQYPEIKCDEDLEGYKIFNPGTHEQTDLHNNTTGACFVITIDKAHEVTTIKAHKLDSGRVRFHDLKLKVEPKSDMELHSGIESLISSLDKNSVIRLTVEGSVTESEYMDKGKIYGKLLGTFLTYEVDDEGLSEEISIEKIRQEYSELSFAAQLMEKLVDSPTELKMAYELMKSCNE